MHDFFRGCNNDFISVISDTDSVYKVNQIGRKDKDKNFGLLRIFEEGSLGHFAKRKVVWFVDIMKQDSVKVHATKECLYVIIIVKDEGSYIRFLDPIKLGKKT